MFQSGRPSVRWPGDAVAAGSTVYRASSDSRCSGRNGHTVVEPAGKLDKVVERGVAVEGVVPRVGDLLPSREPLLGAGFREEAVVYFVHGQGAAPLSTCCTVRAAASAAAS